MKKRLEVNRVCDPRGAPIRYELYAEPKTLRRRRFILKIRRAVRTRTLMFVKYVVGRGRNTILLISVISDRRRPVNLSRGYKRANVYVYIYIIYIHSRVCRKKKRPTCSRVDVFHFRGEFSFVRKIGGSVKGLVRGTVVCFFHFHYS